MKNEIKETKREYDFMNRIIKFRAWDKKECRIIHNKDLCLIEYCDKEEMKANILTGIGVDSLNCIHADLILMQWTGLLDRNGIEIYEGDILGPMDNDLIPKYKGNWVVSFESGTFEAVSDWGIKYSHWLPYWSITCLEVIGNIHENKDLINLT